MADVVVSSPDLTVLGGPREIQVDTNIGPAGTRGTYANYGIAEVADLEDADLAGGSPQYFDTYTITNPASDNYLQVYQYVNLSGVDTWNPTVKLTPDTYSTSQILDFTAGVSNTVEINTALIGYVDIASDLATLTDSRYWFNVQVTLSNYDVDAVSETHYPAAVSVKVEDVFTDIDDETKLPITVYAAEFDGSSWSQIDSKSVIGHISISVVDPEVITGGLGS